MQIVAVNLHTSARVLPSIFGSASVAALTGSVTIQTTFEKFLAAAPLIQQEVSAGILRVTISDASENTPPDVIAAAIRGLATGAFVERQVSYPLMDANAAATAATKHILTACNQSLFITGIRAISISAHTADASNYGTLVLNKLSSAYGSAVALWTRTTNSSGGSTLPAGHQEQSFDSGVTEANRTLTEGQSLALTITKTGTGIQFLGAVVVTYVVLPAQVGNL
jgi:hypothetical protein